MNVADALFVEGVAVAVERYLSAHPEILGGVVTRIAELRAELLTPAEAAELLRCSATTLLRNHVEWGLDKSVLMGPTEPRFYREQIMERARAKQINGAKITPMPGRKAA